jgi:hypothetical protein
MYIHNKGKGGSALTKPQYHTILCISHTQHKTHAHAHMHTSVRTHAPCNCEPPLLSYKLRNSLTKSCLTLNPRSHARIPTVSQATEVCLSLADPAHWHPSKTRAYTHNHNRLRNLVWKMLPILITQNKTTDFQKTATT